MTSSYLSSTRPSLLGIKADLSVMQSHCAASAASGRSPNSGGFTLEARRVRMATQRPRTALDELKRN